jgi:putative membrane protein
VVSLVPFAALQEWRTGGHADPLHRLSLLAELGCAVFAVLLVLGVLRALYVRRRLRAVGALSQAARAALRERIAALERGTSGELAVVVVERSDDHPQAAALAALATWFAGSALLAPLMPWYEPALLIGCQVALLGAGYGLARALPGFLQLFIGDRRATHMAEEQALQEFARLGLQATQARNGALLYVSLLEREVVVLGDQAIDARIGADGWAATHAAIRAGIRQDSLRAGLEAGIAAIEQALRAHFPAPPEPRRELPDHVIVRER